MPGRKTPLVTEKIYHILNRGIDSQSIFLEEQDYYRAINLLSYYKNNNPPTRFSYFIRLNKQRKSKTLKSLNTQQSCLVKIIGYCFMQNHFHFLLKQSENNGISNFISKFTNSYTRYFNTKYKRIGPLYQGKFKSVLIETEQQLLHVSRYIHLNPFSAHIVNTLDELKKYKYSSFPEYVDQKKDSLCDQDLILSYFKSRDFYKSFVFDHADYQRKLQHIKKLTLEKF